MYENTSKSQLNFIYFLYPLGLKIDTVKGAHVGRPEYGLLGLLAYFLQPGTSKTAFTIFFVLRQPRSNFLLPEIGSFVFRRRNNFFGHMSLLRTLPHFGHLPRGESTLTRSLPFWKTPPCFAEVYVL